MYDKGEYAILVVFLERSTRDARATNETLKGRRRKDGGSNLGSVIA
jgi:hypothetical protein